MDRRDWIKSAAPLAVAGTAAGGAAVAQDGSPAAGHSAAGLTENLNPKIQGYRDVALKILKPSKKDLEHGLELHANSVVFDSYGFAPRAAIDGEALKQAALAGASVIELKDMRESMMMTRYVTDAGERKEFEDAWRASGVTCIFQNAGEEGQDPMTLIKRLARFTFGTDMLKDVVSKAATPDDIEAAKKAGRHCLYLTGNGVPLTQQWVSIPDELRYLTVFYQLGIRMMHMTYQRRNMIGDGCGEKSDAGLSDFGRAVVKEMNRVGVIPDCAHSGWQTSLETAQASEKPAVASHSIAGEIYPHIRSKPDNVIKAIADTGGFIGICCISRYLRGSGDISALLDHIDHVAKNFGVDHVAIGTDVAYGSRNAGDENKKAAVAGLRGRRRADFRSLWPKDDFVTKPGMADSIAWTNWPLFTVGLVQRGYSDDDIQKIIGGNVMRVARDSMVDVVAEGWKEEGERLKTKMLEHKDPESIGLNAGQLQIAYDLLGKWTAEGSVPGGAILVGRGGKIVAPRFFGKQGPEPSAEAIRDDGMFLLASITKPLVYMAGMMLVERGQLSLNDPVTRHLEDFAAHHKEEVRVHHLYTHTSGLPDMLDNNAELRRQHAPVQTFIDGAIRDTMLSFEPGEDFSYQSMGTLIVAELVQQISGMTIRDFLKKEIFDPLGMKSTALGSKGLDRKRLVRVQTPEYQAGSDFGWNSSYWQEFGAPWGGGFSSPEDFAVICQMLLNGGKYGNTRILSPASVKMMTGNRLDDYPDLPEKIRRCRPWGLGWSLNNTGQDDTWSDLLSRGVFGHTGSTGTMVWIDPERDGFCLLFTSAIRARAPWRLVRLANAVSAAFE